MLERENNIINRILILISIYLCIICSNGSDQLANAGSNVLGIFYYFYILDGNRPQRKTIHK